MPDGRRGVRRRGVLLAAASVATAAGGLAVSRRAAAEAAWPGRPITLIVPFASGGIADLVARAIGKAMAVDLGQAIVVDNRPGAGSVVGSSAVAHAAPTGYTLLLMSNANAVSPSLFRKLPFDPVKDFAPISTLAFFDLGLFAGTDSRLHSVPDVIAKAKAQPGRVTIGCTTSGSTQHLAAELFKMRTGIDVLIVPYKGTPAVQGALRAAEIDLAFEIVGPMLAQVRAGVVRTLAVTSTQRDAALPQVPTVAESGVRGYDVTSWNALSAPRATPLAVIERLHGAVVAAVARPAVQQSLRELGVRAADSSPAELESLLVAQIASWGEVIRAARIEPQ